MAKELDETEQTFKEEFDFLDKIEKVKSQPDMNPVLLRTEYIFLANQFAKLLKDAVRISRNSDKAQKKLLKYKDLIDTLRNME
ncbi:MAG: hypothetical protein IPG53_08065 [Ignavibacteriales bacterium]|nr:hypothetical protein [Ignavibacteriales bacterium]